jgi:hypothetical protein
MPDYLPRADGDKIAWYNNYNTKIGADGPTVGLSAGDISAIQAKIGAYLSQFNSLMQLKNTLKAATATTRTMEKALLLDVRNQVARLKTHTGFTPAIAQNLDVVGEESAFDPDTFKPNLKVTVFPGTVRAEFGKGETDGINLYCRLRGQTGWKFVARDTNSPYEDHTPLAQAGVPEEREYAARAVLNDVEIGLMSDIVSVTYAG